MGNKKFPKAGTHVGISFKAHTGMFYRAGVVKSIDNKHLVVIWNGHETTYKRKDILHISWND